MANIKSAIKRIDITKRNTSINKAKKSEIKNLTKKFNATIQEGAVDEAREILKLIDKKLKRASHRNIIHKNNASRHLSQLQRKLNNAAK